MPEESDKNKQLNDTARAGRDKRWVESLAKDVYIHEATNVINDMIK